MIDRLDGRRRLFICLGLTVPALYWSDTVERWLGYQAPEFTGSQLVVPVLTALAVVVGGYPFFDSARAELARRQPAAMTLASLAIALAYLFSLATVLTDRWGEDFSWVTLTLVDTLVLGELVVTWALLRGRGLADVLSRLMPETAEVVGEDGRALDAYLEEVLPGDLVVVRPGRSAPVDGVIVEGSTDFDESSITGAAHHVAKEEGDQVMAGTVNHGTAEVRVRVSAAGEHTALASIVRLVADSESPGLDEGPAGRLATTATYTTLALALLAAVVSAGTGATVPDTVERVVLVLVIASPQSLALAGALVTATTTAIAAGHGILIRDEEAFTRAGELDLIAIDKTGLLTRGRFELVALTTVPGTGSKQEALRIAAAAERDSEHPVAVALRREAATPQLAGPIVGRHVMVDGPGVGTSVDGSHVEVGGPRLLEGLESGTTADLEEFATRFGKDGHTIVYLVRDREPTAAFALTDVVRVESREAVDELRSLGLEVVMLTGDTEDAARGVAERAGITRYHAGLSPEDKAELVDDLRRRGRVVAMAGDGARERVALGRSDLGIAVGVGPRLGSQTADILCLEASPTDLVTVVRLGVAALATLRRNRRWAAGYNLVAVPVAALALAPLGIVLPAALGAALASAGVFVAVMNAGALRKEFSAQPAPGP